ncbi:hypothetical protein FHW20_002262 [Ochrobactrum intermedium]|uniref:Biotin transporter BioY n=1 Tax=Brucella intermedia TaxID=94625 RepID=A0ABR6APK6_9HYPH|nr:hypothetical protein [Brucella intermedia]KAB2709607.1 hypothetical protein F9K80_10035 [Brucella intermedia]MBA8851327.1 hypothetical protein [Brucella intermedia]NYD83454.1 hypothetical protein [Brucella intermedia]UXO85515.1 hypothetical protein N8I72_14180 [Brucella intermedia]WGJ09631.1 hypothetical protein QBQ48_16985 [Brucella intermedia]
MESIERAIRNAFAKADAHNPATRQRIYESAWGAHERALATNAALSDAQKEQRRQNLKDAISGIEQEFKTGGETSARHEPTLDAPQGEDPVLGGRVEETSPALDTGDIRATSRQKKRSNADLGYEGGVSRKDRRKKKRHSPLYSYGIPALVLAVAAFIGYSLYNSFIDLSSGPANNPLHSEGNIAPLKEGEEPGGLKWITIFQPSEATRMSVKGRATAEIRQEGTRSFARIQSAGAEDTVTFDVGEGILDQLVGKTATFNIVARADDGKTTQMSVNCDFGGLGDCGRRRYDVRDSVSDFLFDMEMPSGQKAGRAGTITVNSDLSGSGKAVNIYEIRVSTAAK